MPQARDHIIDGAIALDDDGKILGIDIATTVNAGAYLGGSVPANLDGWVHRRPWAVPTPRDMCTAGPVAW